MSCVHRRGSGVIEYVHCKRRRLGRVRSVASASAYQELLPVSNHCVHSEILRTSRSSYTSRIPEFEELHSYKSSAFHVSGLCLSGKCYEYHIPRLPI